LDTYSLGVRTGLDMTVRIVPGHHLTCLFQCTRAIYLDKCYLLNLNTAKGRFLRTLFFIFLYCYGWENIHQPI
jgi:hypothetical protein